MRVRPVPGPRRAALVACLLALCVGWLPGCAAGRAVSDPSGAARPTIGAGATAVRVLQMNLCDSGRADCYSGGRAVSVAAALVARRRPDVVTLNEVCRADVDVLERAMSAASHGAAVASAFEPARDRPTQAPVRCRNGQDFGDGVLAVRATAARGFRVHGGLHPVQDPGDVEERVWVCIDLASQLLACTTHAASTDTAVALAQCRHVVSSAARLARRRHGDEPIIVGGDLNLAAGGSPNPESCLPPGYHRADDGALQHVVVGPGIAVRSRSVIDMDGATDHPGLLVDLAVARR